MSPSLAVAEAIATPSIYDGFAKWTAEASISYNGFVTALDRRRISMRLAIGLFATLAALGGAAFAQSPVITTAGLYTPLPTASSEGLLQVDTKKAEVHVHQKNGPS
jgi:hypothetical protein